MGADPTDIGDLGEPAPKAGVPAARVDSRASLLKFALRNPASDAARMLGVQDHSLSADQISEIDNRVNSRLPKGGFGQIMSGLWDSVVAGFQVLIGQFTGEAKFSDFSKIKAGRAAMRTARPIYEALMMPREDGVSTFAPLAERISGIRPDGRGGFVPVLDSRGGAMGFYRDTLDQRLDPRGSFMAAVEDRGMQPSRAQRDREEAMYQEDVARMYKDPEIVRIAARLKPDPLRPGMDTEANDFVNDPKVMERIAAMTDRFIRDEELKRGGAFKFDDPKVRVQLMGRIKERIKKEHKEHSGDITRAMAETAGNAPPMADLGLFPSPRQFSSSTPEPGTGASR